MLCNDLFAIAAWKLENNCQNGTAAHNEWVVQMRNNLHGRHRGKTRRHQKLRTVGQETLRKAREGVKQ